MEHGERSKQFDKEIDEQFGVTKADSTAPPTEKSVEDVMLVPSLKKFSTFKYGLKIDSENMTRPNDPKEAIAITVLGTDNRSSNVTLFKGSFTSYRRLAYTMMHEMGHVVYNRLGFMALTSSLYDNDTAIFGSERYAYKFAGKYGGIPYEYNLDYCRGIGYTAGLPLKNFGNGWYIKY
jgi:hypothetical protein